MVNGSLDVLENVGKKTIEVLNDKDPNLRSTREFFKIASDVTAATGKPNLSHVSIKSNPKIELNCIFSVFFCSC